MGGRRADGLEGCLRLMAQVLGLLARFRGLALQIAEAVLFRQAAGRRGGRFGGGRESVPAPQVALLRDEALTGLEEAAKAEPVGLAHHADLAQAPLQGCGSLSEVRQGADAL